MKLFITAVVSVVLLSSAPAASAATSAATTTPVSAVLPVAGPTHQSVKGYAVTFLGTYKGATRIPTVPDDQPGRIRIKGGTVVITVGHWKQTILMFPYPHTYFLRSVVNEGRHAADGALVLTFTSKTSDELLRTSIRFDDLDQQEKFHLRLHHLLHSPAVC